MRYPDNDADLLNQFYTSAVWPVFKKHFGDRRIQNLRKSASEAPSFEMVKYYKGGIDHIDWLEKELQGIHEQMVNKQEKEKK